MLSLNKYLLWVRYVDIYKLPHSILLYYILEIRILYYKNNIYEIVLPIIKRYILSVLISLILHKII